MSSQPKILTKPLKLALSIMFLGIFFKIQHYPYASLLLSVSYSTIALLYPFRYWKKVPKTLKDHVKVVLVPVWAVTSIFILQHYPYANVLQLIFGIAFICWLVLEIRDYFRK